MRTNGSVVTEEKKRKKKKKGRVKKEDSTQTVESAGDVGQDSSSLTVKRPRAASEGSETEVTEPQKPPAKRKKKRERAEVSSSPSIRRGKRKRSRSGEAEVLAPRSKVKRKAQSDGLKKASEVSREDKGSHTLRLS